MIVKSHAPEFNRAHGILANMTRAYHGPDSSSQSGAASEFPGSGRGGEGGEGGQDPPVLLALGGELVVERGGAAVDAVGGGSGAVLGQARVGQVQHGAALEGLQAGGGDEAGQRQGLLTELETTTRVSMPGVATGGGGGSRR